MATKKAAPTKTAATKKSSTPEKSIPKKSTLKTKITEDVETDMHIDLEEFDAKVNAKALLSAETERKSRSTTCLQGKQPKVIRDNPKMAPPLDKNRYIQELHVKLSTQNLRVTWTDGTVENWICSPNKTLTPKVSDVVGYKCGPKHTNFKRDGMAWFTALKSKGMVYGFHNSQPVGIGIKSKGCIRVLCQHAKILNQNSWSGKTVIKIVG